MKASRDDQTAWSKDCATSRNLSCYQGSLAGAWRTSGTVAARCLAPICSNHLKTRHSGAAPPHFCKGSSYTKAPVRTCTLPDFIVDGRNPRLEAVRCGPARGAAEWGLEPLTGYRMQRTERTVCGMHDPLFSVAGQVVLVSGASRGIGRAIAAGFAQRVLHK